MPGLSVIVCTYNREDALCTILSDLFEQKLPSFEIVVVDQTERHSPQTAEFLDRHRQQFRLIRVEEPNLPAARNIGVNASVGDILAFLDDDVRIDPAFLEDVSAFFAADRAVDGVAPRLVPEPFEPGWELPMKRLGRRPPADVPHRVRACVGAAMAFRRDALLHAGGFDPALGRLHPSASNEDVEFSRRFTRAGYHLWYVPGITVRHVSGLEGGCANRTGTGAYEADRHMRGHAYVILKERDALRRITPTAWLRLARLTAIRRDVVQAGPVAVLRGLARVRPLARDVQAFVRRDSQRSIGGSIKGVDDRSPLPR